MERMRLDKFLGLCGCCSRAEAKKILRAGGVCVNGVVQTSAEYKICPDTDRIVFCGRPLVYRKYVYIIMNKPQGVVSATEDGRDKTVLDLLPEEVRRAGLFPCGRLDKNTVGLILITDNGDLGHKLLAPKSHVEKEYRFRSARAVSDVDVAQLESGVTLDDGYETKPAKLQLEDGGDRGIITLTEGKYHQIKRMFEARDNKIVELERIRFGPLSLKGIPNRGDWRYLTDDEIATLERHGS